MSCFDIVIVVQPLIFGMIRLNDFLRYPFERNDINIHAPPSSLVCFVMMIYAYFMLIGDSL